MTLSLFLEQQLNIQEVTSVERTQLVAYILGNCIRTCGIWFASGYNKVHLEKEFLQYALEMFFEGPFC